MASFSKQEDRALRAHRMVCSDINLPQTVGQVTTLEGLADVLLVHGPVQCYTCADAASALMLRNRAVMWSGSLAYVPAVRSV